MYVATRCMPIQVCLSLASDQHKHARTQTCTQTVTLFCGGTLGRHPSCRQLSLYLKLGLCCFLCVWLVVACRGLCLIITPLPLPLSLLMTPPQTPALPWLPCGHAHTHTESNKHTHTPLPSLGLGQQPRLQHWDTSFTQLWEEGWGGVRMGRAEMRLVSPTTLHLQTDVREDEGLRCRVTPRQNKLLPWEARLTCGCCALVEVLTQKRMTSKKLFFFILMDQ